MDEIDAMDGLDAILYEKRSRRHDFRPTRHLARTFFVEGSKNG